MEEESEIKRDPREIPMNDEDTMRDIRVHDKEGNYKGKVERWSRKENIENRG